MIGAGSRIAEQARGSPSLGLPTDPTPRRADEIAQAVDGVDVGQDRFERLQVAVDVASGLYSR
jgi:hypothetical protein